jgi:hypothetical protein
MSDKAKAQTGIRVRGYPPAAGAHGIARHQDFDDCGATGVLAVATFLDPVVLGTMNSTIAQRNIPCAKAGQTGLSR